MTGKLRSGLLLAAVVLVSGCASEDHQDLREWMTEQAKAMKGKIDPLPVVKPFDKVPYSGESLTPPFSPAKVVTTEAVADKTAPDRSRTPQPLENFPVESLRVMGVILDGRDGKGPYALIQTPSPNKPKHVRIGEYMGQNFGKVTEINRDCVIIMESVKDPSGVWVDRRQALSVAREGGARCQQ